MNDEGVSLLRQTRAVRFRLATPADATALAKLRWTWRVEEEGPGDIDEPRDAFVDRFEAFAADGLSGRWTVWVAEDGGEIVSNVWIYRVPKVPSPGRPTRDFGYMTNVYTVQAKRNRGIGGSLLDAVTAWAHDSDLELIVVWPSERSLAWYSRAGFAPPEELLAIEIAGYEG